jgi:hypothetical protein
VSGPIVRKYGFPNFEQIFGKRELEHGTDEDEAAKETATEITASGAPAPAPAPAEDAGKPARPPRSKSS